MYKELGNKSRSSNWWLKGDWNSDCSTIRERKMNVVVNYNSDKEGAEKQSKQSKRQAEKQSLYKQMSVLKKEYSVYLIRL